MWAGPREEFRDVIPGHDHRQATLFRCFLVLVLRSCLAWRRSDGDDGELAFLEHGGMPRPQQPEPVPVVAAREDAAEGEDDEE